MISQKCKMQYGKLNKWTVQHVVMRSIDRKKNDEGTLVTRHGDRWMVRFSLVRNSVAA
jgi:hypothetical protein